LIDLGSELGISLIGLNLASDTDYVFVKLFTSLMPQPDLNLEAAIHQSGKGSGTFSAWNSDEPSASHVATGCPDRLVILPLLRGVCLSRC